MSQLVPAQEQAASGPRIGPTGCDITETSERSFVANIRRRCRARFQAGIWQAHHRCCGYRNGTRKSAFWTSQAPFHVKSQRGVPSGTQKCLKKCDKLKKALRFGSGRHSITVIRSSDKHNQSGQLKETRSAENALLSSHPPPKKLSWPAAHTCGRHAWLKAEFSVPMLPFLFALLDIFRLFSSRPPEVDLEVHRKQSQQEGGGHQQVYEERFLHVATQYRIHHTEEDGRRCVEITI